MSKVIFPLFLPSQVQYLATGDSMVNLVFSYRLGHATVMNSVHVVCAAIEKVMLERFLTRPTQDTWKEVAQGFWNFPNCLEAIDSKHIIQAPPLSGSPSITKRLSPLCFWCLWMLTTGSESFKWGTSEEPAMVGCMPDQIWGEEWRPAHCMCHPVPLTAHLGDVPFVMVGGAAFPLKPFLMRPYPRDNLIYKKRIFNYRLSSARMVVKKCLWHSVCQVENIS